ncbi:MAG: GerMN domain-containing protein [Gemmatimonadota bacterium]
MSPFDHHHAPAAAPRGAAAMLVLLAAAWLAGCTAGQSPPPESGGDGAEASAPAAPVPATTAPPQSAWPARQVLQENSLAVATYRPGDPGACGLPAVQPGDGRSTVVVFHGCEPGSGPALDAVAARRVPVPAGADPLEAAVRAQLAGATEAEKQAGYRSNFGQGTAATPFTVRRLDGGLVVVDLHSSIRQQRMVFVSNAETKQLVAALGQFPGVERVAVLVGGQPLCRALGQC